MKRIIFLDIDGVLNCQIFYEKQKHEGLYAPSDGIDPERVGWLNELCKDVDAAVVISSTWRLSGLDYCREVLKNAGAAFEIIDVTPNLHTPRGAEIHRWLRDNCEKYFDCYGSDFYNYAIIDDDNDMLIQQAPHFFQTDTYSGLTPNTCYRIKRFFSKIQNSKRNP